MYMYIYGSVRGWRNTVELAPFENYFVYYVYKYVVNSSSFILLIYMEARDLFV